MSQPVIRVACLGDSITYGYPFGPHASWVRLAGELLGVPMVNYGLNGDSTAGMLERLQRDVLGRGCSHLLLLGGANDSWMGVAVETACRNMRDIAGLALEAGVRPIVGLPTPLNSSGAGNFFQPEALPGMARWLGSYRAGLDEWACGENLVVLDFAAALLDPASGEADPALFVDEGHPSRTGYRALAEYVAAALTDLLDIARPTGMGQ